MTSGESHAKDEPPLERGTRIKTVATRLVNEPRKSIFCSFFLKEPVTGFNGRKKMIIKSEKALNGTVTQNTHRHCC